MSLRKLKPFVPLFYGKVGDTEIKIENLLQMTPDASFMDLKLGTSTITLNTIKKGQAEIDRRIAKDKKTTSAELGYTVCGYCKKDVNSGETVETKYKLFPPKEDIPEVFRKVFESKMSPGKVDKNAVNMIKAELHMILAYFKDFNEHEMRGASLFIVVSPSNF